MNKKILAGLTGIVVAGAFWACGSGEINEPTMEDTVVQNLFSDLDQQESFKKDAYDRCRKDPTCADRVAAVDVPAQPSSSSETVSNGGGTSAPVIAASSSSANIIINNNPSSSSPVIVDPASSGSEDTPAQPVTGLGSCAPTTATIEKGGNTTWTFKLNTSNPNGVKVIDVTKSGKFDWTFTGAEPGTETVEKKMTSSAVTYANSGSYEASVTVAIGTATETIKCAPLQVNGDPITGCECGTAATSVDFTATPDVAWTVTGCTSASDISYEWEGDAGTDSFSKTFDAATASYAPKLKVKNSDNTAIDVTCPAVKVTEGAEYVLKATGTSIEVPSGNCVSIETAGNIRANGLGYQIDDCTVTLTYNDKDEEKTMSHCNFSNELTTAVTANTSICVKVEGASGLKLSLDNW